jgi:hypothetical protein
MQISATKRCRGSGAGRPDGRVAAGRDVTAMVSAFGPASVRLNALSGGVGWRRTLLPMVRLPCRLPLSRAQAWQRRLVTLAAIDSRDGASARSLSKEGLARSRPGAPEQARELIRKHGNDRATLELEAKRLMREKR